MEVPNNFPVEPQPAAPTLAATQPKPIDLSTAQSAIAPQPLPSEPLTMQPQATQSVPQVAPTPSPSELQQIPSQQQPGVSQSLSRPSKKSFLYFGLIIFVLYIVGFGGAWVYSRFFKSKQRVYPVTFSAIAPNVYTEEQAIGAIKKAHPDFKDIERSNDRGNPKTSIRSLQTKTGWKIRFNRGVRPCDENGNCRIEQYYFFTVDFNGLVKEVGQVELELDSNGDKMKSVGTSPPNFFEEDTLNP